MVSFFVNRLWWDLFFCFGPGGLLFSLCSKASLSAFFHGAQCVPTLPYFSFLHFLLDKFFTSFSFSSEHNRWLWFDMFAWCDVRPNASIDKYGTCFALFISFFPAVYWLIVKVYIWHKLLDFFSHLCYRLCILELFLSFTSRSSLALLMGTSFHHPCVFSFFLTGALLLHHNNSN